MAGVRMKWNRAALRELRTSDDSAAEVLRRAKAIAAACGGKAAGYVAEPSGSSNRARAVVIAASPRARRDNARSNRILRNIDAGRD